MFAFNDGAGDAQNYDLDSATHWSPPSCLGRTGSVCSWRPQDAFRISKGFRELTLADDNLQEYVVPGGGQAFPGSRETLWAV